MHRLQLAACLVLLAIGALACGLLREPTDPVIGGWPVGPELQCGVDGDCALLLGLARDRLDRQVPNHARVVRSSLHREGTLTDPATGDRLIQTRSGGNPDVAVFELEDGAVFAIGVGYPGVSRKPRVFATGP